MDTSERHNNARDDEPFGIAHLYQANEISANRVNVYAHLAMLTVVFILIACYAQMLPSNADFIGQGWIYLLFVAPLNIIALLFAKLLGLHSRWLKYVLLGLFTLITTVTAGLCGNQETFLLFLPMVLSIRYFKPRTTIATSLVMIPLSIFAIWLNIKWGYQEINMMSIPEGTIITWQEQSERVFASLPQDNFKTFVNHMTWRFPITVLFLILMGWICTITSLVGRRLVKQQEERMRVEAAEKARSHFFASVSHDIRTPLNAIIGFSELLMTEGGTEEERKNALNSIFSSGKMLLQLINDVLDLSKLDADKMLFNNVPTEIPPIVTQVLDTFRPEAQKKGIQLLSSTEGLPVLVVDPQRIRQVLFNLVGNAVKFTEKGHVKVIAGFYGDVFTLIVEDTGIGISDDDKVRMMQPYVQLCNNGKHGGTGLGLSICKQLAIKMGGELKLKSKLGRGSIFTLVIPNVKVSHAPAAPSKEPTKTAVITVHDDIGKVLIADDSNVNIAMLKAMLRKAGVEKVVSASNGEEALAKLHAEDGFSLVLTDLWMPKMDGEELVAAIRKDERLSNLHVYAVTADVEAQKTYRKQGFDGILLKPLTLETLQEFLNGLESTGNKQQQEDAKS